MQRNIKLALAAVILIAGFAAALLFRRSPSATADGGAMPSEALPYRVAATPPQAAAAVTLPAEATAAPAPGAPPATGTRAAVASSAAPSPLAPWSAPPTDGGPFAGPTSAAAPDASSAVPSLPSHYDPSSIGGPAALPAPPAASWPTGRVVPTTPSTGSPVAGGPPLGRGARALQAPLRTHSIVDGDTLARIAADYLGDPSRQGEILELNREVLGDQGDLLPIGAVLKIPPTVPAAARQLGPASDAASSDAAGKLVPIPTGALRQPVQTVVPRQLEPDPAVHP